MILLMILGGVLLLIVLSALFLEEVLWDPLIRPSPTSHETPEGTTPGSLPVRSRI